METSLGQVIHSHGEAYTLERKLGSGGFANVFLARGATKNLPKEVAVKFLKRDLLKGLGPEKATKVLKRFYDDPARAA